MIKLHLARRLNHHMGGTHSPGFFRSFLLPFGTSPIARLGLVLLLGNLYFYLPFYALYLQSLGLDLVQISELSILLLISTLLFEIPGGMLADHIAKKKSWWQASSSNCLEKYCFFMAPCSSILFWLRL